MVHFGFPAVFLLETSLRAENDWVPLAVEDKDFFTHSQIFSDLGRVEKYTHVYMCAHVNVCSISVYKGMSVDIHT